MSRYGSFWNFIPDYIYLTETSGIMCASDTWFRKVPFLSKFLKYEFCFYVSHSILLLDRLPNKWYKYSLLMQCVNIESSVKFI